MQAVKNLIEKGKRNGTLCYGEIMDALEEIEDLDAEQIDKIYESLEEMGIEVLDDREEESEETTSEKDSSEEIDLSVPEGVAIDDPVRILPKGNRQGITTFGRRRSKVGKTYRKRGKGCQASISRS